jgi:hypothetical protein
VGDCFHRKPGSASRRADAEGPAPIRDRAFGPVGLRAPDYLRSPGRSAPESRVTAAGAAAVRAAAPSDAGLSGL